MRRGGCLARLFIVGALIVIIVCAGVAFSLAQPYRGFAQDTILDISKGTGTRAIAEELAGAGVIRYSWQFMIARALRPSARLQAGEYQFAKPASVWKVFDRLVRGDVFYYELTIPEGSNMFDIAALVDHLGFVKGVDFLKIARSPALIRDLAPGAPTLEGYLFPSTYRLTRQTTAAQLAHIMTEQFRRHWSELADKTPRARVNEIVTLASLVEKETAVPAERPRVAAVYANRLRLRMALDCDPTTIYAALLENRYRGVIHRSDLASPNAYNTYQHAGLPPGPIANPGVSSLQAALAPAPTEYLYFVAKPDGSGGHNFSTTLAEHNRAVQQYRQGQR
jgi:UPF0755 protein